MGFLIVAFVAATSFAQVMQPPAPLPGQPQQQRSTELQQSPDEPIPAPDQTSTTARPSAPAPAQLPTPEKLSDLMYDTAATSLQRFDEEGFRKLNDFWNLPDFLMSSRRPENTVDQPDAADLNDVLTRLIPGLLIVAMVLTASANAIGLMRSGEINPLGTLGALTIVGLFGLAAVNNRLIQHYPINLLNLLLSTVAGAPIRDYASAGMNVYIDGVSLLWAAVVALVFLLLLFALTVVLFIEGAWCIVLGSMLALLIIGSITPFFSSPSQFLIRRWLGSLFSPLLVFVALKLGTMILGNLPFGTPDTGRQFLLIAFAIVAWQAPGVMVGAISVQFPGLSQVYFARRMLGGGGNAGGTPVRQSVPSVAPVRTATPGVRPGGGNAVTNRAMRAPVRRP